jgi:hypothetical protein
MRVENDTLKKLTTKEVNGLGLGNIGCNPIKGIAKTRLKGLKTTMRTDNEIHYESDYNVHELIKLADVDEIPHWVHRVFNKESKKYEEFVQILMSIEFVK